MTNISDTLSGVTSDDVLAMLSGCTNPFAAAVRGARVGMIIADPRKRDHPIIFANDAFCSMTGYSRQEIMGRDCRFLHGPETDRAAIASIRAAIEAAEPIEIEILNYRKNGEVFWNRLLVAPVHGRNGQVEYFFSHQIDITMERKRAAEIVSYNAALNDFGTLLSKQTRQLLAANERLRAELEERGRIEDALRQARKMEAIGQFTTGIAHDFNNFLSEIMSSLDMLRRRMGAGRTDGVDRYISVATAATQRAAALSHRLLGFARRQSHDPRQVDVHRLISGLGELFRSILGPRIDLEIDMNGEPWPVLCDPNQFENAVLNMIINARDAMQADGRLTVLVQNVLVDEAAAKAIGDDITQGEFVALSVSDSGTGMSNEVVAQAFEPFFTTKSNGRGTGLGLSMVFGFVKQSGGTVTIDSKLGQGTTFRLYLPRHCGAAESDVISRTTSVGQMASPQVRT